MYYIHEIIEKDNQTEIKIGWSYNSLSNDNTIIRKFNTQLFVNFSNNNMEIKYKLKDNWILLVYPYNSYKIINKEYPGPLVITVDIPELLHNYLVFVIDVIDTPDGVKGPHYKGFCNSILLFK